MTKQYKTNQMKVLKINNVILLLISVVLFNGCVEDDEYSTPNSSIGSELQLRAQDQILGIDEVLSNFNQGGTAFTFEDNPLNPNFPIKYTSGYVVSSDEGGNFFEELVIQDSAENPTAGIVIKIDVNPLFIHYEFGRKVYIKLNGLTINEANGVLQLGRADGDELEKIVTSRMAEFIIISPEVAEIVPLDISVSEFSNDMENLYIRLHNMQFNAGDVFGDNRLTFAGEDNDQFDGERHMINCDTGASVIMSTSTFSDFKSLFLPQKSGSISGVLTRDFFDDFYTLVINSPEAINFNNSNRCDPVFEEVFADATDNTTLNTIDWINYAESGSKLWTEQVFGGNGYAEFNPYNSGDASNIGWLITPSIELNPQTHEILTFDTAHAFPDSGHNPLEVLISTNFDGTEAGITSATWMPLGNFMVSYITEFSNWYTFVNSGVIDLSSFSGTVHIAFKYTGSDTTNQNMTLHIDNIKIRTL